MTDPLRKPTIIVPGSTPQAVQAGGIPAQVVELPNGGELTFFAAPPKANGIPPIVAGVAPIPPGVLLLALDPETSRKVRAAIRPTPIV